MSIFNHYFKLLKWQLNNASVTLGSRMEKKHFPESKKIEVSIMRELSKRCNIHTLYHSVKFISPKLTDDT